MADVVAAPALTATVVAVCDPGLMQDTSETLRRLRGRSAVRTILISLGDETEPAVDTRQHVISIAGLVPKYLNNAVASTRLSSLPSIAWWRGGDAAFLPEIAELVDRLVIGADDPREAWRRVESIAGLTMVGDLRWTALTRWRNLMAHFFDVPEVAGSIGGFTALEITGSDPHTARLFAGWLRAELPDSGGLRVRIAGSPRGVPLEAVALHGAGCRLALHLAGASRCIHTSIEPAHGPLTSRAVPLGDQSADALLAQELRIRARDTAFERALRASGEPA